MDKELNNNDSSNKSSVSNLIPYGWSEKLEENSLPWVEKISVTYNQPADCCADEDAIQAITLTTEDNGVAPFIRISIPHEQYDPGYWSIGSAQELVNIISDFEKRVNYHEESSKRH